MDNSNKCNELHEIFNSLKRFTFPFNKQDIPLNGMYILFEKGEYAHGVDRIVRVGTHTGEAQLPSRLKEHFINQNKDRSIFRKNIGRAILNKNNDDYLNKWEWDLTTRANKEKYSHLIDKSYQQFIEDKVSKKIQDDFSFIVFEVNDKKDRLLFEYRIISEVSNCKYCNSSAKWLGNHSPKAKIQESGLWQVNELYKQGFSNIEFERFCNEVSK